jgi:GT2 family glycosyltransferase
MPNVPEPDVSIVYTNWNTGNLLRDCLKSMYELSRGFSYEVIVVDDASTDGTVEMLAREFPQVRVLRNESNQGVARSYNRGIEASVGRYIQILNSDMLFIENSIKTSLDFLEKSPSAAAAGAWLLNRDMTSQVSYGNFPSLRQGVIDALFLNDVFPHAGFPNRGTVPSGSSDQPFEVDYATGASMLLRTSVVRKLGAFDLLYTSYCEETDLCYRIRAELGMKVFFLPNARIIHFGGASFEKLRRYQIQLLNSSYNKFLIKHHGKTYALLTRLLYVWTNSMKLIARTGRYLLSRKSDRAKKKNHMMNGWFTLWSTIFPVGTSPKS